MAAVDTRSAESGANPSSSSPYSVLVVGAMLLVIASAWEDRDASASSRGSLTTGSRASMTSASCLP